MPYYMPRCQALLEVPVMASAGAAVEQARSTETFQIDLRVQKAELTVNDHNAADELQIDVAWQDAGIDPRTISAAVVAFWMGDAYLSGGRFRPTSDTLRFLGIVTEPARELTAESKSVKLRFLDYTTLLLTMKPFPDDGVPDFSQRLDDAWRRICDNTGYWDLESNRIVSSVAKLRDNIVLRGNLTTFPLIGAAVAQRLRGNGKIQVKPQSTAWDVWQQAVGMCGLISYIDRDQCIVADATNYYTSANPPRLIWGRNILTLSEKRNTERAGKRVALSSYDPLTNTTIEAFWPPRDSRGPKPIKKPRAKTSKSVEPALVPVSDYELLPYPYGVTDPGVLEACARRVWEERSRQELIGRLSTVEMRAPRDQGGPDMDLLNLRAGDVVRIEFEKDTKQALELLQTDSARLRYLVERAGYSEQTARLMVANLASFGKMPPLFHVKQVRTSVEFTPEGGSYSTEIEFLNRIQEDGAALADLQP